MLDRRTFLTGLLAAPAIVRAGSLDFVPRGSVLMPAQPGIRVVRCYFDSTPEHGGPQWFDAALSWREADAIERMHRA